MGEFSTGMRKTQLLLILVFIGIATGVISTNYRSHDGYLGKTTPTWQTEIINGTAPAPFVYRQAVPRLRALCSEFLLPGHAAVLVDVVFYILASIAAHFLFVLVAGVSVPVLPFAITLGAISTGIPNTNPEMVATLFVVTSLAVLYFYPINLALVLFVCSTALVRPELPVIFGVTQLSLMKQQASVSARPNSTSICAMAAIVSGLTYLVMASQWFWPDQSYALDTPVFMLPQNFSLTQPLRIPCSLVFILSAIFFYLHIRDVSGSDCDDTPKLEPSRTNALNSVCLFSLMWIGACMVLGKTDEFRLLSPLIVPAIALALREFSPSTKGTT